MRRLSALRVRGEYDAEAERWLGDPRTASRARGARVRGTS